MAKAIVMPKLGLTMTEGLIGSWHKKEGEEVAAGEILFSVETDKLTNDIESSAAGVLRKVLVGDGETAPCLATVAVIAGADEDISDLLADSAGGNKEAEVPSLKVENIADQPATQPTKTGRILASPAVKKAAAEKGIDLSQISGTGPKGRIGLKDLEAFEVANKEPKASPMAKKLAAEQGLDLKDISADGRIMKADVLAHGQSVSPGVREERVPMSAMRRVITKRMSDSWVHPAVTFDIDVVVSGMKALKDDLAATTKVSYTDIIAKCAAAVLGEFPLVNCSVDSEELIYKHYVNMGIAVALEDGLVVPVVKDADRKGMGQIAAEIKELATAARAGTLSPDAMSGGTFTISNLGMFGIDSFSPIINEPEVAILGVNAIRQVPVIKDGAVAEEARMKLSLTADHRAVDGAVAAAFLKRLKAVLENPAILLA